MKKSTLIFLSLLLLSGLTLLARTFHAEAAAAWDSVQHLGAAPWAGVLMLSLLNYGLRFVRWHQTIRRLSGQAPPMLKHLLIYVAGFAFTTTPGKAGEALRGLALKPFGVEYRHSFAAFVWERLMDMLVVLALCSAVLLAFPAQTWLLALAAGLVGCLILVLRSPLSDRLMQGLQQRCPPDSRWARWTGQIRQTRRDTAALLRWAPLSSSLLLGLGAWVAEGLGLSYVVHSLGAAVPVAAVVGVYALSMLVGALSFIPGGLGSSEAVMVLGLSTLGCPLPTAAAATVICRMSTLWFAVLLGLMACALLGGGFRRPLQATEETP